MIEIIRDIGESGIFQSGRTEGGRKYGEEIRLLSDKVRAIRFYGFQAKYT